MRLRRSPWRGWRPFQLHDVVSRGLESGSSASRIYFERLNLAKLTAPDTVTDLGTVKGGKSDH